MARPEGTNFDSTRDTDIDTDISSNYSALTPPETLVGDTPGSCDQLIKGDNSSSASSVPWPGSTFIIRCRSSGRVITFLQGQICLASPGGPGSSIHWDCVESGGWLGFRNAVTNRFLGYDANKGGELRCAAKHVDNWEQFCVRMRPDGGYVLLMTHWLNLGHVGIKMENGVEKLIKRVGGLSDAVDWEFVKVEGPL